MSNFNVKPIIKWSGRKYRLLESILRNIPEKEKGTYLEPFLGSASVYINVENFNRYIINDNLKELMITYKIIRNNSIDTLYKKLNNLEKGYNQKKSIQERGVYFYKKRDRFNRLINLSKLNENQKFELASLFLFLNQTCFNGVYRKNSSGNFNVPHGRRASNNQKIKLPQKNELMSFSKLLKRAVLKNTDYKKILTLAKKGDFVYLDPPYVKTVNYYGVEKFDNEESQDLKHQIDKLHENGVNFLLSNSNTYLTKEIFMEKDYRLMSLKATRTINRRSKSKQSQSDNELLISNFDLI